MKKEVKPSAKVNNADIELLFGGFLKLIKKNLEIQIKEEQAKEWLALKSQLTAITIENVKLKQKVLTLEECQRKAEDRLGCTLDSILKEC